MSVKKVFECVRQYFTFSRPVKKVISTCNIGNKNNIIPEIILINNSLCVLTQDNGKGWELTDKDNIVISFDKYKSDITVSQDLIIGYVKDGIMYEGEVFDELSGKYSFSPDEKGEYFFYLLSGSSDYLSLKSGNLEVN